MNQNTFNGAEFSLVLLFCCKRKFSREGREAIKVMKLKKGSKGQINEDFVCHTREMGLYPAGKKKLSDFDEMQ